MSTRRIVLLRSLAAAGSAAIGLPRFAHAQGAYKAEYKMSTVVPPAFAWGKGGEIFLTLVKERTNGRINIKQYPGASLVQGQQDREFSAMRQGVIDVLCGAPINWTSTVPQLGVFTLPFLMPDHKAWDAVMASELVNRDYFEMVRKAGAEPLAIGETGYRQISNSKRPLIRPDDLKGLKVRVVGSPMYGEIMSSMGANPTFMSWADTQPALASGAVDAQENPLEVFLAAKVNTLGQKFVTKWNYSNDILLYAIAAPVWAPRNSRSRWCASSSPRTWSASRRSASTSTCRRLRRWRPGRSRPAARMRATRRRPSRASSAASRRSSPRRARHERLRTAAPKGPLRPAQRGGAPVSEGDRAARPPRRATLPVDDSIFFKLVRVVNLTARPFSESIGKAYHLSLNEWRVLLVLANHPRVVGSEVAALTGLDKMTVSRAIAALERRGRVVRKVDATDRRRMLLRLSAAGERVYERIGVPAKARERSLFRGIGDADQKRLGRLLDRLIANLLAADRGEA
jgi:TRAP-type C4-dicarboxylate transport system substrate-binding protein/DNA-binding MarR family transcriptional regulator